MIKSTLTALVAIAISVSATSAAQGSAQQHSDVTAYINSQHITEQQMRAMYAYAQVVDGVIIAIESQDSSDALTVLKDELVAATFCMMEAFDNIQLSRKHRLVIESKVANTVSRMNSFKKFSYLQKNTRTNLPLTLSCNNLKPLHSGDTLI